MRRKQRAKHSFENERYEGSWDKFHVKDKRKDLCRWKKDVRTWLKGVMCNVSLSQVVNILQIALLSISESLVDQLVIQYMSSQLKWQQTSPLTSEESIAEAYLILLLERDRAQKKKRSWIRLVCCTNVFWGEVSYHGSRKITLCCCCRLTWFPCRTHISFESAISVRHRLSDILNRRDLVWKCLRYFSWLEWK